MTQPSYTPERAWAVAMMRAIEALRPQRLQRMPNRSRWPPLPGSYVIGDLRAPVAVCTLTNTDLIQAASVLPGVVKKYEQDRPLR
jgi:hypothetical protein